jgi:hypothetical protein
MQTHVVREWTLPLTVDLILAGQGADPDVIRRRRPQLVDLARRALDEASDLLHPQLAYRRVGVSLADHDRLRLANDATLTAPPLLQHLGAAQTVIALTTTIGPDLETRIAECMTSDPAYALALDGLGTVAVDALTRAAYRRFESEATAKGLHLSRPCSPGMVGWPLDAGQRWLFSLLDPTAVGITVLPSGQMEPRKSCSAVVGAGRDIKPYRGRPCATCPMHTTCDYQRRHPLQTQNLSAD